MLDLAILGIGFPYIASMPADLYQSGVIDFVEVTPESLCRRKGDWLALAPGQLEQAHAVCGHLPTVVHGTALSIGSTEGCNTYYLKMLDAFRAHWPFAWHSEHLGFHRAAAGEAVGCAVDVPLPLPATREAIDLVAPRASVIGRRYEVPFLLENPAYYLPAKSLPHDAEIFDDIGLIRRVMQRSGCYQLLNLHNVYCNALNHRLDPFALIDRMALDRVVEIHICGGSWRDGFWTGGHTGRVPPPIWRLLEYTLRRTPNIAGVVLDLQEPCATRLGPEAIAGELQRLRATWLRSRMAKLHAAA